MKYVSTFLVGFVAGAAAALLLTPINGRKMQKKVVDKIDDIKVAAMKMAS
jgi:gas vesicle protein